MKSARSKHRILVVEDDRTSRKLLCTIIEKAGYDVIEAATGKDAMHIAEMWPPEAMVVDVMLPDMQGTDLVEELFEDPAFRYTKCIFLTGILSKKAAKGSYFFKVGNKTYRALPKPVRKDHLLQHLALAIQANLEEKEAEKKRLEEEQKLKEEVENSEDPNDVEDSEIIDLSRDLYSS